MLVRYFLLTFPIHRRPFDDYYQAHDREVEGLRPEIEREWGLPWEELPPHIRLYWQDQWYWPPWYFNDIAGYLRFGSDGKDSLAGDLFLQRGYFPEIAPERFSRQHGVPEDSDEVVYLASISRRPIILGDNSSYLTALAEIVEEGIEIVRRQDQRLNEAELWVPGYDLSCLNLARADAQLRERFPERVDRPPTSG